MVVKPQCRLESAGNLDTLHHLNSIPGVYHLGHILALRSWVVFTVSCLCLPSLTRFFAL